VSQFDPGWSKAALSLQPGDISDVIDLRGKYVILQRMPRNFREEAEARFNKAMDLRKEGKRDESAHELLEALKIYPQLLRALTYLGVTYGEAGNPQTSAAILTIATRLYPQDAGAHFNLGIAYGALGRQDEISEYNRAIEINPDLVLAYLNLGAALYAKGQYDDAILAYREGLNVNPLIASLHYSLSIALEQRNNTQEAKDEMALALKIDPNVGKH
jgi:tetratricopeptide (TPR) repeat protein